MATNQLKNAIELAKSGDLLAARQAFIAIIKTDPQEVLAWLWLVDLLDNHEEKITVLERCLKINPDDPMVRDALTHFQEQQNPPEPPTVAPAVDVRTVYDQENKIPQKNRLKKWLKPILWLFLLAMLTSGIYFGFPYLKNLKLSDIALNDPTPDGTMAAAATWTPQVTGTPTITPSQTPNLPVGFGTLRPEAAAPISIWDADQLVAFAQWGDGTLLGLQWQPDDSIFALNSRGFERFDINSRESLEFYQSDNAWQASVMNPAGKWLLYSSAGEGLNALDLENLDTPIKLEDGQEDWKLLAISADASTAAAVSSSDKLSVWDLPSGTLRFQITQGYGQIRSIAFSSDGRILAIGGHVGFVWLLNASDGVEQNRFFDLEGAINALAFSDDGQWLASAGVPQTIAIWDLGTGKIHHHVYQEFDTVSVLRFSTDKSLLAIGLNNGDILLWNDVQRQYQDQLTRHHAAVLGLSFSQDQNTLCSAAQDGALLCWDLTQTLSFQTLYPDISGSVFASAITPNGKNLILAGSGAQIHIIDIATETEIATLKGHLGSVYALDVSADGKSLLSAGRDGTVRLWSLERFEAVATLGSHATSARSVVFSPDANLAASAGDDEMVKLWDLQTLTERRTLIGHTAQVQSVSFAPDGLSLLSGSDDGSVCQWDVKDGRLMNTFKTSSLQPIYTVRFLPDGKQFISGNNEGVLALWNLQNGQIVTYLRGHVDGINTITTSSDGSIIATGDAQGRLIFWDSASNERIRVINHHTNPLIGLVFTANAKAFFSIDRSGMVLRWETTGLQPPAAFGEYTSPITAAAIAPGGTLAALAGLDRSIRVIDLQQGTLRYQIRGLEADVAKLAFSPGGTHLAGGSNDGSVQFWASSSGVEELFVSGAGNSVTALCFEPSGKVLLVGRANHSIERRDVRSGNVLETMVGHSGAVTAFAFAPNEITLASGSTDGMVLFWDMDDNSILHRINAHRGPVTGLQFDATGEILFSTSEDGSIYAWRSTNADEVFSLSADNAQSALLLDKSGELLISGSESGLCFWSVSQQSAGPCHDDVFGQPAILQMLEGNEGLLLVNADGTIQLLEVIKSHVPAQTPTPLAQNTAEAGVLPQPTSQITISSLPVPLYFLTDKSGTQQIWRLDADGRTAHQITQEEQPITAYDVSRTSDHIVYVSGNDLILIDKATQNRWVLIDGEDFSPTDLDARRRLEISTPIFSPDGWRIAYALNGIHIYSILDNSEDMLLENDIQQSSLQSTIYTPIFFSPGGNNLYVQQSTSSGMALIVLNSWTGEVFTGPLPGPCCQPVLTADQDAVIFTGIDKYGSSVGLWVIDVWYDQLTEILPLPVSGSTHQINAFPKQLTDGSLYFFFAQTDGKEVPPLMMASTADDGISLLQVVRADSYDNLKEVLWADDGSFALLQDPVDGQIKKLMSSDTPPILLPISGTMMRWGE